MSPRGGGQFQRNVALGQSRAEAGKLDLDNLLEMLLIERMEDDDFVDTVQELGPEMCA